VGRAPALSCRLQFWVGLGVSSRNNHWNWHGIRACFLCRPQTRRTMGRYERVCLQLVDVREIAAILPRICAWHAALLHVLESLIETRDGCLRDLVGVALYGLVVCVGRTTFGLPSACDGTSFPVQAMVRLTNGPNSTDSVLPRRSCPLPPKTAMFCGWCVCGADFAGLCRNLQREWLYFLCFQSQVRDS
jgi:hypothetical protein